MADLSAYRAKRRFDRTAEPTGGEAKPYHIQGGEGVFVVQMHAARRLHYDLRLEINGVLKSWAVPQGPCLDPKIRRFAKETEDHPLEYAAFEGVIPKGEYGGGEMIVWDRGTWASPSDIPAALAKGELKFRLAGEKLSGGFMLKRLPKGDKDWLLIKERDDAARPLEEYDVAKARPESVLSGRTVEDLRGEPPPAPSGQEERPDPAGIPGAKPADLPQAFKPMLATAAELVPVGEGWVHEIKYDGYRTLCFFDRGQVRLITRNGLDWTKRYAALARALTALPCETALLDGEIVVQDARGVARLDLLETALSEGRSEALTYFCFDLLHLDGQDLTGARLLDRKAALKALIAPLITPRSPIQFSEHIEGDGAELFAHASRMGVEGVVSKRADSRYLQARSKDWVKIKRVDTALLTVIGFTTNAPKCVAALILAEDRGEGLVYCCRAGSGIGDGKARELYEELSQARLDKPVIPTPRIAQAHWIEPRWLAEIGYRGRSGEDTPRAPTFLRLLPKEEERPKAAAIKPRLVTDRDLAGIRLTNPEREMFEGSGVSKLDIALHYARVGDWALPEILRRPMSLIRCPSGRVADCFYQRHAFAGLPPGLEPIELAEEDGRAAYVTVTQPQGYLALAQFGAVELHLWGCRIDDPEHPDRLILDLDPDPDLPWSVVCDGAEAARERLQALGLTPFLRTTGGKGLHLVCALEPAQDWGVVKGFAKAVADAMAAEHPRNFTANASKAKRKGKIYLDYLRNGRGATAIASYSLRAKPSFPVATPISWTELRGLSGADAFDRQSILPRLAALQADPWEDLRISARKITQKMRRAVGMAS